ncbi:MAG: 16S rRNA (cytidine(1402)-2'-O)-methyltransferase [Mycobacteriales bacterium]
MTQLGRLVLAATPLGNPGDASARLIDHLRCADVIAAEDTRRLRRLTTDLGVTPTGRVLSYYDGNESSRTPQLIEALLAGQTVLLVTDAGMPSISDPGYRLVSSARARTEADEIAITVLPGPSAVTTALALSGLPCDRFCFEGFLPRKATERRTRLAALAAEARTMVFFEAPHRLAASLAELARQLGADREAAVCRELTKTYEQVKRAPLEDLAQWATEGVRGEITLVVAGAVRPGVWVDSDVDGETVQRWMTQVLAMERHGVSRKQAIAVVAESQGAPRRQVYNAVVAAAISD